MEAIEQGQLMEQAVITGSNKQLQDVKHATTHEAHDT